MKRLAAVLALAGCNCTVRTTPAYFSRCGAYYHGFDAHAAQQAEDVAAFALGAKVRGWNSDVVCEAIRGWSVRIHQRTENDKNCTAPSWRLKNYDFCVLGYTDEPGASIWVPTVDLEHNSFTHELVHVVDLAVTGKPGHCNWEARGVKEGIKLATGKDDESDPESDCEP